MATYFYAKNEFNTYTTMTIAEDMTPDDVE